MLFAWAMAGSALASTPIINAKLATFIVSAPDSVFPCDFPFGMI
jgi:hypothetical protein